MLMMNIIQNKNIAHNKVLDMKHEPCILQASIQIPIEACKMQGSNY